MSNPLVSKRRANAVFNGIILIGLGLLAITDQWWPGILLVIGTSLATSHYLRGRQYDMVVDIAIFGGLFAFFFFNITGTYLLPVLLITGGIFVLYREWAEPVKRTGEEAVVDKEMEIEDEEESFEDSHR